MSLDYFILLKEDSRGDLDARTMDTLQSSGMRLENSSGSVHIFTSTNTPALHLPTGGMVIGDLYSRDGNRIHSGSQLLMTPSSASATKHNIIQNYWGDYILLLPDGDSAGPISVTRSPSSSSDLPCFYSLTQGIGFVTSNVALAIRLGLCPKRIDPDYVVHRLVYPSLRTGRTGLSGISELMPGCTVCTVDGNVIQDWSPWAFADPCMRYGDLHEAAAAIRSASQMVVKAFADQDKSTLLELSGGLDSSIVGACLMDTNATVFCNTLTSPDPGADEQDYAGLVANMIGADLLMTELQYDDALFKFPLPERMVTPVIGPLQVAVDTAMIKAAEHLGTNSYFSGAGGDTIFCYLTSAVPAADAFRGAGFSEGIQAVRNLSLFHQCTYWKAGRLTLRKLGQSHDVPYGIDRTFVSKHVPLPTPEHHPWLSAPENALAGDRQRIFQLSGTQFFRDSCLRAMTRRVRMPLLSQPVVEACLRAPSWMWFSGGQNRAVARQAFADRLPPKILARRSKGTFTAYLGALYRRRRRQMLDFLLDGELTARGILDAAQLLDGLNERGAYAGDTVLRVLQLCTLENWARQQSRGA